MKLPVISLFTGAGGLDIGVEAAGFQTAVAGDFDARSCETLRRNRAWPVIEGDLNAVTSQNLLERGKLGANQAALLIGGPPCQPFSKSGFWATGEAKGLSDPRAKTLETYLRVLGDVRPRAFLLENVEGFAARGKQNALELVQRHLARINKKHGTNYQGSLAILNAADFGVPQIRRRAFVVGSIDGQPFKFPEPTHQDGGGIVNERRPWLTAWDAFHDLPVPQDDDCLLRGKWAALLPSIPEGENYLWHTERGGGQPLFGWRRRYWSFLLKLAKNAPSWTIQAQPGPATGPFHWANRRLTAREMARLQSFPDAYEITGSLSDAQRQLGNAVPCLLAEVLARAVREQFFDLRNPKCPTLSMKYANKPLPKPARPRPVPPEFSRLLGVHLAHPGTGQGFRALART
jgi:DNA (cytosine-5)-methyltransferase 1